MRKKFTTRFIETVVSSAKRVDFFDQQEDGLLLRVTGEGTKTFAFRYRRKSDGQRRYLTLGRFPDMSLEAARRAATKARITVWEGGDPAGGVETRKAAPTFAQVVDQWLALHASANRSNRVRRDDQSMLQKYILPRLGTLKAQDIGRQQIAALNALVQSAGDLRKGHALGRLNPRRLTHRPNRVFELVRAILRWAHAQGTIPADPTAGMKRPVKSEAPRQRDLSWDEIATVWNNLHKLPASPGLQIAIKLSLVTGQRIGEVCGIAKSELDLTSVEPTWTIPAPRTKNKRDNHRVPLSPLAVALVREALALQSAETGDGIERIPSPFLFPARAKRDRSHGPIMGGAASVALFRGRKALGIEDFRIHDLRRTAGTRMAELGINPHTISLILNHISASKSTITSKVYVQYSYDKEKREALERWGEALLALQSGCERCSA